MTNSYSGQTEADLRKRNRLSFIAWLTLIVFCLLVYSNTFVSIVMIWVRSDTFAHGFLIPLIVVYLIYNKRDVLARSSTEVCYGAVVILLLLSMLWQLAELVNVLIIKQLAVVSMLVCISWIVCGTSFVKQIRFPLATYFL